MLLKLRLTAISVFLIICLPCNGQTIGKLSKPRLEQRGNLIYIHYDILNSDQNTKFKVWIEVTDSTENKIIPKSVSGDLGENITGGSNKRITWDFIADSVFLDNGIYVQVYSELILSSEIPLVPEPLETFRTEKEIKLGGVIIQSILFPGWGLSRINRGPHWLKGVAGYGLIAASVYYNKKSYSYYETYLVSDNSSDMNDLYNSAIKNDKLSKGFAYSAIGIWLIDVIWTASGSSKLKNHQQTENSGKLLIHPVWDLNRSMITVKLNF